MQRSGDGRPSFLTIPPEILSEVFRIGQAQQDELSTETADIGTRFELLVSGICLRTRDIALTTPRLWSTIRVSPFSNYERVAEYLNRSACAPLDVRILMRQSLPPPNDEERTVSDALLDLVLNHSLRWQSLSIAEGNSVVRRICDYPAPDLRYLSLSVDDVEGLVANTANFVVRSPHIFRGSTKYLRFIHLQGLAVHLFRPQFDAVVTLHLEETRHIPLTYHDFRDIVIRSPYLANLSIDGDITPSSGILFPENDIPLPALRSLRICGVSGEVYAGILRSIQAPNLEALTLKGLQEHDLDILQHMMDISKFTNLRCLKFCDFDVSVHTYENIMRVFRNITCFCTLHSMITDSRLVELLLDDSVEAENDERPWPSLKNLSFYSEPHEGEGEVLDMLIESRNRSGCPMRRVSFGMDVDDIRDELREERAGVKVVYSSKQEVWPSSDVVQVGDIFDD